MLDKMVDSIKNTGDIMFRYQYQRNMMLENLLSDCEIDTIADRVIQRIRITADISEVVMAIDEIEKRLNDLMK